MGVRIPTGFVELKMSMSKKGIICFQCMNCGQKVASEYEHSAFGKGVYHKFQAEEKKMALQDETMDKLNIFLEERDKKIATAINQQHKYRLIEKKIYCPFCKEAQLWSVIPPKSKGLSMLYHIMLTVMILMFFLAVLMLMPNGDARFAAGFMAVAVVMGIYPICTIVKKKKIMSILGSESFVPPIYICTSNFDEYTNSPWADFIQTELSNSNL